MPDAVPDSPVAPHGADTSESTGDAPARKELYFAFIVAEDNYLKFERWVRKNVRVVKQPDWEGEVFIIVLPDDGETVDFNQFPNRPTTLTLPISSQK